MASKLLLHCGGQSATLEELQAVPLPEETDTYKPVAHFDLAQHIARVSQDLLHNHEFHKGIYALSKNGQRMFGILCYQGQQKGLGLSIGFRNSYDKSMSIGLAVGGSVLVCDNLMLSGRVAVMRKHTTHVIEDLEKAILEIVYRSKHRFVSIVESMQKLQAIPLEDDNAFRMLGLLFGRKVLSPRQLPIAKYEWLKPSYPDFQPRNAWSLYNAATAALKSTPPHYIMERHIQLHDVVLQEIAP